MPTDTHSGEAQAGQGGVRDMAPSLKLGVELPSNALPIEILLRMLSLLSFVLGRLQGEVVTSVRLPPIAVLGGTLRGQWGFHTTQHEGCSHSLHPISWAASARLPRVPSVFCHFSRRRGDAVAR